MSDELASAFGALREGSHGNSPRAAKTRAALLAAAARPRRRGRRAAAFVLPLAAALAVSAAWAAIAARHAPRSYAVAPSAPAASAPLAAGRRAKARPPARAPQPTEAPAPSPSTVTVTVTAETAPPSNRAEPRRAAAPARALASDSREQTLYLAAHEAHFRTSDAASALRAWNAYLDAFPEGRFAPEARYNRAILFVRLGRYDDAKHGLAPFADAPPGSYRRAEARALRDALEARH